MSAVDDVRIVIGDDGELNNTLENLIENGVDEKDLKEVICDKLINRSCQLRAMVQELDSTKHSPHSMAVRSSSNELE